MNPMNTVRPISLALFLTTLALGVPRTMADGTAPGQPSVSTAAMTTILPPKEAEALFKFYFNGDALFGKQDRHHRHKEFYWTPTAADVAQAEAALATSTYPRAANSLSSPRTIDLNNHFRQYAGVMRGEKKCLLINAFAASSLSSSFVTVPSSNKPGGDWHDRAVLVFDGGFDFFHTSYNSPTHQIAPLEFNGFA